MQQFPHLSLNTARREQTKVIKMAYASDIRTENGGIADRFAALTKKMGARFARYKTYRRTLNELAALSDAELRDLGLCRAQIRSVAYEHVLDAH